MSTLILRRFLSTLGYATYGWELGRNIGPTSRVVSSLPERLHEFRARHDGPVSVIGWSLGGIFARQLGRRHPDVIRQVITLASPIRLQDHAHSNARRAYELLEKRHTVTIQLPLEAGLGPLPVPATSVYTRLDGIVAWRACLDQPSRLAENVEVYASHFGIGNHPAALWVIADRLTQAPGKWTPFRPPARWRCATPPRSRPTRWTHHDRAPRPTGRPRQVPARPTRTRGRIEEHACSPRQSLRELPDAGREGAGAADPFGAYGDSKKLGLMPATLLRRAGYQSGRREGPCAARLARSAGCRLRR